MIGILRQHSLDPADKPRDDGGGYCGTTAGWRNTGQWRNEVQGNGGYKRKPLQEGLGFGWPIWLILLMEIEKIAK
ncbi:MAG: hypothetical protein GY820_27625 [Gammaproteobacteria bacterium]|nr:hypothetical protein [Gammaproteobacteria bacterium]